MPVDVSALAFPKLAPIRRRLLTAVAALAKDEAASLRALKLGPKGAPEVARNRAVKKSPTMPALERYTGVLYDALDAGSLSEAELARANDRLLIHSALFGLIRADDHIPAYRLSHDSRLPNLPLKAQWSAPIAKVFAAIPGLILDARSEGYVELGPRPIGPRSVFLRVVTRADNGTARALNHFNKKAKGEFARALLTRSEVPGTVDELIDLARLLGWELQPGDPGEVNLFV